MIYFTVKYHTYVCVCVISDLILFFSCTRTKKNMYSKSLHQLREKKKKIGETMILSIRVYGKYITQHTHTRTQNNAETK
jgi:hypothetical protein